MYQIGGGDSYPATTGPMTSCSYPPALSFLSCDLPTYPFPLWSSLSWNYFGRVRVMTILKRHLAKTQNSSFLLVSQAGNDTWPHSIRRTTVACAPVWATISYWWNCPRAMIEQLGISVRQAFTEQVGKSWEQSPSFPEQTETEWVDLSVIFSPLSINLSIHISEPLTGLSLLGSQKSTF